MITALLWRNIWRNKRRSLITMASVAFAVLLAVTMKSLQDGVFDNLVRNVVSFYSGYIQIHKTGYFDDQILDNGFTEDSGMELKIKNTPAVTAFVPRLESFVLASSDSSTHGCLIVGTNPQKENAMTLLASKIIKGNYITGTDKSLIIAEGIAARLKVGVNDTLVLLGQGYHGNNAADKFHIKGIAHFGSPELNQSIIYMPLRAAQEFLSAPGLVTTIAVNLDPDADPELTSQRLAASLTNEYEVLTWQQIMPDIANHIKADSADFYIFIGILYLLIGFGMFGTILMMMAERKYEMGMLLAIGMRRRSIALMLFGETILMSLLGTIAGLILSWPLVRYLQLHPIRFGGELGEAYKRFGFDPVWPTIMDPDIFLMQALIVLCIAVVIGVFPVLRVRNLDPVTAMKR